jgi:hypothetical protein
MPCGVRRAASNPKRGPRSVGDDLHGLRRGPGVTTGSEHRVEAAVGPVARMALAFFVPGAVVLAVACGLAYLLTQQGFRSGGNEPQVQLAEDAVGQLNTGSAPADVVPSTRVDLASSLAPFVTVEDAAGRVVATNGLLDGNPPSPPAGVAGAARASGRDIVTWQPRQGVRIALVAIPWTGGTVLAGRSLRLVEQREDAALALAVAAGLAGLLALAVASYVAARLVASSGSVPPTS